MKKKAGLKKLIENNKLILQLYVAGMSARSMEAIENLKNVFRERPEINYELEIIDIYKNPDAARQQHIVFSPSLIKQMPLPKKILIGNLSNKEKIHQALGINI